MLCPSAGDKRMKQAPDPRFRNPRIWSNRELKNFAKLYSGKVANVSAGDDIDKEGLTYREYFSNAESYVLTNYPGADFRGFQGRDQEIPLDLTAEVPSELVGGFDVAFNHTTMEHIFDVFTAFSNLCQLSRDTVICIVPFCQVQHEGPGYLDYWRFTPTCLRTLFEREGVKVIYESAGNGFNESSYLFFVGSKCPEKWEGQMPEWSPVKEACAWVGATPSWYDLWRIAKKKLRK